MVHATKLLLPNNNFIIVKAAKITVAYCSL